MIDLADIQRFEGDLSRLKILVIGDLMLDRYHFGRVNRISPEAPVPIVDVEHTDNRPGGAANVALNIRSLGAQVALCGVIGHDDNGRILQRSLTAADFDISLVLESAERVTTTKTRIIGNNQQVLRVDYEVRDLIAPSLQAQFLAAIAGRMQEFDAVVFEDYDKGMLGEELIQAVIGMAQQAGIPTVVDPKFRNFWSYGGATLFKPNLKELNEALGLRLHKSDLVGIEAAVADLRKRMPIQDALVTLSENGMVAISAARFMTHIQAHFRKITDVSGAGDTVIAVMALALALRIGLPTAAFIANLAGGLVCEEVGVVPVDKGRLMAELGTFAH
jgi:D-glycero-beta-D-manno-heptose-7-phosphate kinase